MFASVTIAFLSTQAGSALRWMEDKNLENGDLFLTLSRLENGPDDARGVINSDAILLRGNSGLGRQTRPHEDMLLAALRSYISEERGAIIPLNQSIHQAVKDHLDGGRTSSLPMSELLKDKVQERKGVPDALAGTEEKGMNGSLSSSKMTCTNYCT